MHRIQTSRPVLTVLAALPAILMSCTPADLASPTQDWRSGLQPHSSTARPRDSVTVRLVVDAPSAATKSDGPDGAIGRLDVYGFSGEHPNELSSHATFTASDIAGGSITVRAAAGTSGKYFLCANLDEDCAAYLASPRRTSATASRPRRYSDLASSLLPATTGVFREGSLPMGGAVIIEFDSDKDVHVTLHRYNYRIDILDVRTDFSPSSGLQGKEAELVSVTLADTYVPYRPVTMNTLTAENSGTRDAVMGPVVDLEVAPFLQDPVLGKHGRKSGVSLSMAPTGSWSVPSYEKIGSVKGSFPYLLHRNYSPDPQDTELVLSTPRSHETADFFDATHVPCGRVLAASDAQGDLQSRRDPFPGVVLYGIPGSSFPLVADLAGRSDYAPRIILEVRIDGQVCYYPIHVPYPQSGTRYVLSRITLRGQGSPCPAFYPGAVSKSGPDSASGPALTYEAEAAPY